VVAAALDLLNRTFTTTPCFYSLNQTAEIQLKPILFLSPTHFLLGEAIPSGSFPKNAEGSHLSETPLTKRRSMEAPKMGPCGHGIMVWLTLGISTKKKVNALNK
jgi:hypothetical protein